LGTRTILAACSVAVLLVACAKDATRPQTVTQGVRVVNAYTLPVDLLVDGALVASGVPPGQLDSAEQSAGAHTVAIRATGSSTTVTVLLRTGTGALSTVAAVVANGALGASAVDDTNAVVPAGATKVRVLHLAPNAGEIEVYRTQPDWHTPISWQFPFLYDSLLTDPAAHPFLQSGVGTWDIRAWRKPSEVALGWDGTTAKVTFTLASGEKRTVLVLDNPGGGIRLSVIE